MEPLLWQRLAVRYRGAMSPSGLRPVEAENLRVQARDMIRTSILTGELGAGELYSSRGLAKRLGVSSTPVREALLALVNEGLMEPVRNRGFRVLVPSDRDLDEILELRLMVEVPATGRAAQLLSARELDALQRLASTMATAAERGDLHGFLNRDMDFHLQIVGAIDNARVSEVVRALRLQTRLNGLRQMAASGRLSEAVSEHFQIVDALRARDTEAVEALMRRHLGHTRGVWAGRDEDEKRPVGGPIPE